MTNTLIAILERYTSGTALHGTALVISRGLKETKDKKEQLAIRVRRVTLVRRVRLEIKVTRDRKVRLVRKEPLETRVTKDRRVTLDRRAQLETKVKKVRRVLQAIKAKREK